MVVVLSKNTFAKFKAEESRLTSGGQCMERHTVKQQDRQEHHEELVTEEIRGYRRDNPK
jgi:hypothetical protein